MLEKNRLEALTDGVYAIAMTLLVLNLDIGKISNKVSQIGLFDALKEMHTDFFSYFLGFFLLASLWLVSYRQNRHLKSVDESFIWINILSLVFISLIPFSTSLIGEYEDNVVSAIFFHLNLLVSGLLFLGQWYYLSYKKEMWVDNLDKMLIRKIGKRNILLPIIALAAIVVAFWMPGWSMILYMLIPFFKRVLV